MSIEALQQAKSDAVAAKARFLDTLGQTRHRLKPGNLANTAWTGVKGKSVAAACNAVGAAKRRPKTIALVLGGLALFLARKPLGRALGKVVGRRRKGNEDEA